MTDSPFNLPSNTRNSLAKILVVHVVAAGLTLLLLVMTIYGFTKRGSESPAYLLTWIILSVLTILLTLLSFLVDILVFVPNLDWGTWVTLAATILNTMASIMICTTRRRLSTRRAMRARIEENEEINGHSYYNSQHLQDPEPEPQSMAEIDKATLPKFAQFESSPYGGDVERIPLNRLDADNRSTRSETPSRSQNSPPHYPLVSDAHATAYAELNPGDSPYGEPEYSRARIPYGNPPRQPPLRMRELTGEQPYDQGDMSDLEVAPPLVHNESAYGPDGADYGQEDVTSGAMPWQGQGPYSSRPGERQDQELAMQNASFDSAEVVDQGAVPADGWQRPPARSRAGPDDSTRRRNQPSRAPRQRVVSGPRPMPSQAPARRTSESYYEDIPPQFDQTMHNPDEEYMHSRLGNRRRTPQNSVSLDRPTYPQPRSPDTLSVGSHFTSVSQRGVNPHWHSDLPPQQRMGQSASQQSIPNASRQETRLPRQERKPQGPNILADNPDFVLPGAGAKKRLPASRRPGVIPGLSSSTGLGSGSSPYAITKGL